MDSVEMRMVGMSEDGLGGDGGASFGVGSVVLACPFRSTDADVL